MRNDSGKILSPAQIDALARIQAAIIGIEKRMAGINDAIKSHELDLRAASAPSLGFLMHDIEGLMFAHDGAVQRDLMASGMRAALKEAA